MIPVNSGVPIPTNNALPPLLQVSRNEYDEHTVEHVPLRAGYDSFQFNFGGSHLRLEIAKEPTAKVVKIERFISNSGLVVFAASTWLFVTAQQTVVIFIQPIRANNSGCFRLSKLTREGLLELDTVGL